MALSQARIGEVRRLYDRAWQVNATWEESLGEAERLLREHLAKEPDCVEALTSLGAVLSDVSRHQEAIEVLRRAVAHGPTDANAYYNLAVAMMNSNRHRGSAMGYFHKATAREASAATLRAYFDPHGH